MPFSQALVAVRRELVAVGGFSLLINLLMLVTSIYMLQVFDRVLSSGSFDTLLYLSLIAVVALAVYGVLEHVRRQVLNRAGEWLESVVGPAVLAASQRAALRGQPGPVQGLRQLREVRSFLAGEGVLALIDAPWTPIFIILIWFMHPLLGAIALGGALIMLACAGLNDVLTRPATRDAQNAQEACERLAGEAIANAEVARALGMSTALVQRWQASRARGATRLVGAGDRAAAMVALSRFLRLALQIAILGTGAHLVLSDQLTAGGMVAGSILLSRALAPTERAIMAWRSMVSARTAQRGLKRLMGEGSCDEQAAGNGDDRAPDLPRPIGRLSVRRLIYMPPGGDEPTLKGVTFSVGPGEACAVVGPSGAGKSTLARLITGVWTPQRGEVRLDGAKVSHWGGDRACLGYLPQDVELCSGTVARNISRMADHPIGRVIEAAERAGAHEAILALPQAFATEVGEGGRRLSGGLRQRIGLARALFDDPVLVVLDEPNANLDTEGEAALARVIRDLKARGCSVVVITHQSALLCAVDKVLVLRAGVGELFGPRDEVLAALKARKVVPLGRTLAAGNEPTRSGGTGG